MRILERIAASYRARGSMYRLKAEEATGEKASLYRGISDTFMRYAELFDPNNPRWIVWELPALAAFIGLLVWWLL